MNLVALHLGSHFVESYSWKQIWMLGRGEEVEMSLKPAYSVDLDAKNLASTKAHIAVMEKA